jgi:hypothetical protein
MYGRGLPSHSLFGTSAASSKLDRTIVPHPSWHNFWISRIVGGGPLGRLFSTLCDLVEHCQFCTVAVYHRTCTVAVHDRTCTVAVYHGTLYLSQMLHLRNWIGQLFRIHFGTTFGSHGLWGVDHSDVCFRHCVIWLNIANFVQSRFTIARVRSRYTIARLRSRFTISLFIWHRCRVFETGLDNFSASIWDNLSVAILAQAV